MATEAQLIANQENAKKSTGPVTLEGKKRSSQNAMTHGIFAKIPFLPDENEAQLNELANQITETYKPTDAIELGLVERIILSNIRQIRLREAEAAKLKVSMMPEVLAETITEILRHSTLKKYNAENLSVQAAYDYRFHQDALKEIKNSQFESKNLSIETIAEKMPNTMHYIKIYVDKSPTLIWSAFIQDPLLIRKAIREVRLVILGFIETNTDNSIARSMVNDIKMIHRIPQGSDMALFSKYQVQIDTDLFRAMKMLQDYRNNKAKLIEGEVIEG